MAEDNYSPPPPATGPTDLQKLLMQINAQANHDHACFIDALKTAAARNKKNGSPIKPEAFEEIAGIYNQEFAVLKSKVNRAAVANPGAAKQMLAAAEKEATEHMQSRIAAVPDGEKAWLATVQATQGDGFFTPIIKKFFDSDRGGVQWAPLIGALLGGFLAYNFGSMFQLSTGLSIVAAVVGAGAMAYVLDKPAPPVDKSEFHFESAVPGKVRAVSAEVANSPSIQNSVDQGKRAAIYAEGAPVDPSEPLKPTNIPRARPIGTASKSQ